MSSVLTQDEIRNLPLYELDINELRKILAGSSEKYGVMSVARNCDLSHDLMEYLHRCQAGGGDPAYVFLQLFRYKQPNTTIAELKECFVKKTLQLATKTLNTFPNIQTIADFSDLQLETLAQDLQKLPQIPCHTSWEDMARHFKMQSEIGSISNEAIKQKDQYSATHALIEILSDKGWTIGKLLDKIVIVGNVRAARWIRNSMELTEDSLADSMEKSVTAVEVVESQNEEPIPDVQDGVDETDASSALRKRKAEISMDETNTSDVETIGNTASSTHDVPGKHLTGENNTCLLVVNTFANTKKPLKGYDIDKQRLERTFKWLNFTVINGDNLTAVEMGEYFEKWSQKNFSAATGLVIIILSHGKRVKGEDVINGNDGKSSIPISKITRMFNDCKSLSGKPKLYFIQACRGDLQCSIIPSATVSTSQQLRTSGGDNKGTTLIAEDVENYRFYATTPDKVSYVHDVTGSWFIQSLCDVLGKHSSNTHLLNMSTMVKKEVQQKIVGNIAEVCQVVETLTEKVYFKPRTPVLKDENEGR